MLQSFNNLSLASSEQMKPLLSKECPQYLLGVIVAIQNVDGEIQTCWLGRKIEKTFSSWIKLIINPSTSIEGQCDYHTFSIYSLIFHAS